MKALSILDEVIATIRASKDKRDAKNNLIAKFGFTEAQAEAIVSLQLYRLTNTDITALRQEAEELAKKIEELTSILESEKKLFSVIKKELKEMKKRFADERRSKIEEEIEELKINLEVMIASEDVIVTVTKEGYVKRTSLRSYTASNGQDFAMKDSDRLLAQLDMNTTIFFCCLQIKEIIYTVQFMNCLIFAGRILVSISQISFRLNVMKKL